MTVEETPQVWESRHLEGRYRIVKAALQHARSGVVDLERKLYDHPLPNGITATGLRIANDLLAHAATCHALRRWDTDDDVCTHAYCPLATIEEKDG